MRKEWRKWDWCALMIDVHPDELKHCLCKTAFLYVDPDEYRPDGSRTAREAFVRIPGKHRNKDAAWDALEDNARHETLREEAMKRSILIGLACVLLGASANAAAVVTNATGPYNYPCSVFTENNQRDKVAALAFAQGYAAAMNLQRQNKINLEERWRELNAYVISYWTDKTTPLWHRPRHGYLSSHGRVIDAVEEALDAMVEESPGNMSPDYMGKQ